VVRFISHESLSAIFIAAVIRAICSFDAKKGMVCERIFVLNRYSKNNKNFFNFSDFSGQLSAFLIEISRQFSRRQHSDG